MYQNKIFFYKTAMEKRFVASHESREQEPDVTTTGGNCEEDDRK